MSQAEYNAFGVKSVEAIANLRAKLDLPSYYWDQYEGKLHGRSFSVAGATRLDLVSDFHESLDKLLDNGGTLNDFRKDFDKIVNDHGWEYNGKRGWRTNVIYQTNMRTARMAGQWHQIERNKKTRPYLMYVVIDDNRLRDEHSAWGKPPTILPIDDTFWSTHYPPNGWGCRCTVRTISERDLKNENLTLRKPDLPEPTERINSTTGEVYGKVPVGIDVGWNHNVGLADLGADKALGKKIMSLPPDIRKQVINHNRKLFSEAQSKSWSFWLDVVSSSTQSKGRIHSVAILSNALINKLDSKDKLPESALITVDENKLSHLQGTHKGVDKKGLAKAIPIEVLESLPKYMNEYDLALWDLDKKNIILVLNTIGNKRARATIAINTGRKRKGELTNSVSSLGLIDERTLKDKKRYEILEGKW